MMTSVELRSEARVVPARQPGGSIFLRIDGERFAVREVRNMSQTGVSLVVAGAPEHFAGAQRVEIDYKAADVAVAVNGIIAWSRAAEAAADATAPDCVLGIQLLSPNLLLTFID